MGYGFVKFVNENDAANAIKTRNGMLVNNKKIKVSFARILSNDMKDSKLYITNLPSRTSAFRVRSLFAKVNLLILLFRN